MRKHEGILVRRCLSRCADHTAPAREAKGCGGLTAGVLTLRTRA
jgi:hypothetical protein